MGFAGVGDVDGGVAVVAVEEVASVGLVASLGGNGGGGGDDDCDSVVAEGVEEVAGARSVDTSDLSSSPVRSMVTGCFGGGGRGIVRSAGLINSGTVLSGTVGVTAGT
jgi:hypothetical protein